MASPSSRSTTARPEESTTRMLLVQGADVHQNPGIHIPSIHRQLQGLQVFPKDASHDP